jgi:hypothetical protein
MKKAILVALMTVAASFVPAGVAQAGTHHVNHASPRNCYYCVQCQYERGDGSCYWKDMYKCYDINQARRVKNQMAAQGMNARIVERVVQ